MEKLSPRGRDWGFLREWGVKVLVGAEFWL